MVWNSVHDFIIQNPIGVLVTIDLLTGLLLYYSFRRLKIPSYAYLSFFTFFPAVLGMQNILRQWVATVFIIFILYYLNSHKTRLISFFMGLFSHNSSAVFFPFLYLQRHGLNYFLQSLFIFICTSIIIWFASHTKSGSASGSNFSLVYVFILVLLLLVYLLSTSGKLNLRMLYPKLLLLSVVTAIFCYLY